MVTSQVQIIPSRSRSYKTDLGGIRPAAAVGTAGHPDDDLFLAQFMSRQQPFDMTDEGRQIPLRFRQRQRAGGQRHTGDGVLPDRGGGFRMLDDPVFFQYAVDQDLDFFPDVGDDDLLVDGEAEIGFAGLRYFQQGRFERYLLIIQDPAVLHEKGIVPESLMI